MARADLIRALKELGSIEPAPGACERFLSALSAMRQPDVRADGADPNPANAGARQGLLMPHRSFSHRGGGADFSGGSS